MLHRSPAWLVCWTPLWAACSSQPPANDASGAGGVGPDDPGAMPTALTIESEVGALDKKEVQRTFREAMNDIDRCVTTGRQRLPLLGGAIEVVVRVDLDGAARWAYLLQSDLGDHDTEACILDVLRERTWPRPTGGEEGETSQQLDLGDPEERPPVPWSEDDLGRRFEGVADKLRQCRRQAGTGPLDVTFYVDPNGRALAAGVAAADPKGADAVDCVVRTIRSSRFPSPGSYPAKVTVQVD